MKSLRFNCELKTSNLNEKWKGEVKRFINYGSHFEVFMESRSSILILFGKTSQGGFSCMPDFEVGCHLVNLQIDFGMKKNYVQYWGKLMESLHLQLCMN